MDGRLWLFYWKNEIWDWLIEKKQGLWLVTARQRTVVGSKPSSLKAVTGQLENIEGGRWLAGQKTEVCDWTLGRISSMEQTRTRYKLAVMGKSPRGSISIGIVKVCISLKMNNFERLKNVIISPHNSPHCYCTTPHRILAAFWRFCQGHMKLSAGIFRYKDTEEGQ